MLHNLCVCGGGGGVFVNLNNLHAMSMLVLSSSTCRALQYFSHFLINGKIFEKKVTGCKICALIFSTNFV